MMVGHVGVALDLGLGETGASVLQVLHQRFEVVGPVLKISQPGNSRAVWEDQC